MKTKSCLFTFWTIVVLVYVGWEINNQMQFNTRGINLVERGEYTRAMDRFDRAVKKNRADYEAVTNRGITQLLLGNYPLAMTDLDNAIVMKPELPMALSYRSIAHLALGETKLAIADADAAVKLVPLPAPNQVRQPPNRPSRAVGTVSNAWVNVRQVGGNWSYLGVAAVCYSNRATVRRVSGDIDGAIADCNTILGLDPDNAVLRLHRGIVLQRTENVDQAQADISAYTKLFPQIAPYISAFSQWPAKDNGLTFRQLSLFLDPPINPLRWRDIDSTE